MADQTPRLEGALDDLRIELGMQWNDIARAAGISQRTLDRIRQGGGTRLTRRAVERGFGLRSGAIAAFLSGAKTLEREDPDPIDPARDALVDAYQVYLDTYGKDNAATMLQRDLPGVIADGSRAKSRSADQSANARPTTTTFG